MNWFNHLHIATKITKNLRDIRYKFKTKINSRLIVFNNRQAGNTCLLNDVSTVDLSDSFFSVTIYVKPKYYNDKNYKLVTMTTSSYIHSCLLFNSSFVFLFFCISFFHVLMWTIFSIYFNCNLNRFINYRIYNCSCTFS